jgi:hypothetical protein
MDDRSRETVNSQGFTVLYEAESPIIEWVPLFVVLFTISRVVPNLLKYCLHSRIYGRPSGNVDSEEGAQVPKKARSRKYWN